MSSNKPPLSLIVGPTAVGKTELAIQLAERLNGEIVSADSRLFYRGMDIGTAKPTREEQARVPHHLIDLADPDEILSLAVFQQKAREVITDIHTRNKIPFLVGGTGQYIRAVTEGWTPPEVEPDERLREEFEKMKEEKGIYWLHDKLRSLDPDAAQKIDPRNYRRTIRARLCRRCRRGPIMVPSRGAIHLGRCHPLPDGRATRRHGRRASTLLPNPSHQLITLAAPR